MRMILVIALGAFVILGQAPAAEAEQAKQDAASRKKTMSYSFGYATGGRMKNDAMDIDPNAFVEGFKNGFAGDKAALTEQEMRDAMDALQKEMKAKAARQRRELAEANKKAGEAFLAENAAKVGVVTLPSGLQYKIIAEGAGRQPAKTDKVTVHYRGVLIDGTEFDSSHKRGKPAVFDVGKVIKGWAEALRRMKEGSRWILYVPANLAYGEQGTSRGGSIGPNQTLIFEVELISVGNAKKERKR